MWCSARVCALHQDSCILCVLTHSLCFTYSLGFTYIVCFTYILTNSTISHHIQCVQICILTYSTQSHITVASALGSISAYVSSSLTSTTTPKDTPLLPIPAIPTPSSLYVGGEGHARGGVRATAAAPPDVLSNLMDRDFTGGVTDDSVRRAQQVCLCGWVWCICVGACWCACWCACWWNVVVVMVVLQVWLC